MTVPETITVPRSVAEAFSILDGMLDSQDKQELLDGGDSHFGLGLWIRNAWYYGPEGDGNAALLDDLTRIEAEKSGHEIPLFLGGGDMFSSSILDLYREHLEKAASLQ